MNNKPHRVSLTDEDITWIARALRSAASAGHQGAARRLQLRRLADRLEEMRPGNPNMTFDGNARGIPKAPQQ